MTNQTPPQWTPPQWMNDCINHYLNTEKRGPSTAELIMWREADASCRLDREVTGCKTGPVGHDGECS